MAAAASQAALFSPPSLLIVSPRPKLYPNKICCGGLLASAPSPSAAFPRNTSITFPFLVVTPSPRLNPKHASSLFRVSCFLSSSQLPLPPGTTPATDAFSTTRTVAAVVSGFIHGKVATVLSHAHAPTASELARLVGFLIAAAQHVLGLSPNGSAVDYRAPLLAVAGAASKWVGLYSEILMVVCLLSWFPNMPWDRQPLSAMRDLTDPYMRLFRGIIPPVFGTMDVSSLIGFALLGVLRSILHTGGAGGDGGMWAD